MLTAIKHCLSNLTNGNGRDARQTFWFYVLFLVILQFVLGMAISIPMTGSAMMAGLKAAKDNVPPDQVQAQVMAQMAGSIKTTVYASAVIGLIMVFLMFTAFVRRLHDSGKPGWIAALVAVLHLGALGYGISQVGKTIALMGSLKPGDMQAMAATQQHPVMGLIGWIPFLIVVAFGVMGSTPGSNRYGAEPEDI